jgi:hypothetical protein
MNTTLDTKINYTVGGVVWDFDTPFTTPPIISIGIQLSGLADNIYPLSHKIISLTESSITIKVYKVTIAGIADLLFSECASNDVIVHVTAEGE